MSMLALRFEAHVTLPSICVVNICHGASVWGDRQIALKPATRGSDLANTVSSSCVNSKRQGLEIKSIENLSLSLLIVPCGVWRELGNNGRSWIRENVNSGLSDSQILLILMFLSVCLHLTLKRKEGKRKKNLQIYVYPLTSFMRWLWEDVLEHATFFTPDVPLMSISHEWPLLMVPVFFSRAAALYHNPTGKGLELCLWWGRCHVPGEAWQPPAWRSFKIER